MNILLIATIVFYVIFGIFGLIGLIGGIKKGLKKSIVSLIMTVAAIALACVVTVVLINSFSEQIINLIMPLIENSLGEFLAVAPSLNNYLIAIILGAVAPVVFLPCFIIMLILCKILGIFVNMLFKLIPMPKLRLVGGLVSLITGLAIAAFLLMPISGYINAAGEVFIFLEKEEIIPEGQIDASISDLLKNGNDEFIIKTNNTLTGFVFTNLTTVETQNGKLTVFEELNTILKIVPEVKALAATDFSNIEAIDVSPLKNMVNIVDSSESIKTILAEIISAAGTAWNNNEAFMGLNIKESLPEAYKNSLDEVILRLKNTTPATVAADLNTFVSTIETLKSTYQYVSMLNAARDAMTGTTQGQTAPTKEELSKSLSDALNSLTPESADIISGIVTPELLEDAGLDNKTAGLVSEVLQNSLTDLAKMDDETRAAEATALNNIITYTNGVSVDSVEDASALVNDLMSSEIIKNTIVVAAESTDMSQALDETQKQQLSEAVGGYRSNVNYTAEDEEVIAAVFAMFGLSA